MARRFEIIGKDNCPYCDMAQNLLAIRNEDFTYTKYTDIEPEAFDKILKDTGHKTFPFIFVSRLDRTTFENDIRTDTYVYDFIGGFDKLKEYLNKND